MRALHIRGRGLPDGDEVQWWIHRGVLSAEPIANADTIFDGGWIIPGLVDAHCHVGIGPGGAVEPDEAERQAEAEEYYRHLRASGDAPVKEAKPAKDPGAQTRGHHA